MEPGYNGAHRKNERSLFSTFELSDQAPFFCEENCFACVLIVLIAFFSVISEIFTLFSEVLHFARQAP